MDKLGMSTKILIAMGMGVATGGLGVLFLFILISLESYISNFINEGTMFLLAMICSLIVALLVGRTLLERVLCFIVALVFSIITYFASLIIAFALALSGF